MMRGHLLVGAVLCTAILCPSQAADLTYPVPEGSRWALLRDADQVLVREDGTWPRRDRMAYDVPGHTWLRRIVGAQNGDPRIYTWTEVKSVDAAAHELRISYQRKWRTRADFEALLDGLVTQHSQICAQGRDIHTACLAAAGIAQQLADGDTTATTQEKTRARICAGWAKECVRPNEVNGARLAAELLAAFQTRGTETPAPVPDLDAGWVDAPVTP
jgi:hypothetical protein